MNRILFVFLLLAGAFLVKAQSTAPYVILVSFDGFRFDYVSKYQPPNLKEFIRKGAAAEGLIPSFPSKTFPNHFTLVTGLYPGHHGLVDNQFYDPDLHVTYRMKDKQVVMNPAFYGGVPLWQLAQQQGLRSASFFWVGSETPLQGRLPDYYYKYNESVPNLKRIDQTITWLNLPEQERPHFISLYFSLVDTEGHSTGPASDKLRKTVLTADSIVGDLMSKLKTINLPVNVILVSDHGMYELKQAEKTYITLQTLYNIKDSTIVTSSGGTQVHLYTEKADSLYDVLKKKEKDNHFTTYKRKDFPARWHYDTPRAGDLLLVAEPGYYFRDKAGSFGTWDLSPFGVHGYDPQTTREMQGIFYAQGPNIKDGVTIKPFENIHVYPLVAKILGLTIPKIDGDIKVLDSIYRK
jgi:alkaline phosphatase D